MGSIVLYGELKTSAHWPLTETQTYLVHSDLKLLTGSAASHDGEPHWVLLLAWTWACQPIGCVVLHRHMVVSCGTRGDEGPCL